MKLLFILSLMFITNVYAQETSYCHYNGSTQVCINYHSDDNGNVNTDTSIQYNQNNQDNN